ncbi:MAG TPA: fluoride efflux transporter CrcB, partial [Edaphobacter sp.]|nr:fluoride efflux transporter CrcB [Edaphobacter sp.]
LNLDNGFPFGTVMVNILGCFVIGFMGTFTLSGSKHEVSENLRLFVMVGICGGFTTFSSFSLQTFDLVRSGAWGRALANIVVSVVVCFVSVAAGHRLAQRYVPRPEIAQNRIEEYTG